MKKYNFKTYSLVKYKDKNINTLYSILHKLGFDQSDFKIVHFGSHNMELKVMNPELNHIIKTFLKLCP